MPPEAAHPVAVLFLGDLRLVSGAGALAAYLAWLVFGTEAGAGLGRLGLGVVWAATAVLLVLSGGAETPMRDWVLLGGVGLYLLLSLVFTLSVLGGLVSIGALVLTAVPHVATTALAVAGGTQGSEVVRYWSTWRDVAAAASVSMVALAVGAGGVRALLGDRRVGLAMAPNDLLSVSRLLGIAGAVIAPLGLVAAIVVMRLEGGVAGLNGLRLGGLLAASFGALAWLRLAEAGEGPPWRVVLVGMWNLGACGLVLVGARLAMYLTPPAGAP